MEYLLLLAGFVLLIVGADWMVHSASSLAKSFGVSAMVVGLTVVAIGTSVPEAAIGVMSSLRKANQLTLGDVIGSSIANIALIIGFSALLRPLAIPRMTLRRDIPFSIWIQAVLVLMFITGGNVSRLEGGILLAGMVAFVFFLVKFGQPAVSQTQAEADPGETGAPDAAIHKRWRHAIITLLGLAMVAAGSRLIVDQTLVLAFRFGLSEAFIGATVVALGTSLPELVVSLISAKRREHDLMIGNIIGSNIFNVLFVIGLSSTLYPIDMPAGIEWSMVFMLATSVLFLILAHRKKRISRLEGVFLLAVYIAFIVLSLISSVTRA
jgi:cation:H+ antiporter